MNNDISNEYIYTQAAHWIDVLSDGEMDTWTKRRFIKWLNASPEHRNVFESMLVTWQDPAITRAFDKLTTCKENRFKFSKTQWISGIAACCLIVLAGTFTWYPTHSSSVKNDVLTVQAGVNNLTDGSSITVQPSSEVIVEYSQQQRHLQLRAGQAYFAVAKDKQRPFIVSVDATAVKAVGTEFNIDRGKGYVDVIVYEGVVEITNAVTRSLKLLKAGERVRVQNGQLGEVNKVDLKKLVDWRSGWIEMSDESLSYLVAHLNRYSDKPIVLTSNSLRQQKVAGRFKLNDSKQAVELLSQLYSLNVEVDDKSIRLMP